MSSADEGVGDPTVHPLALLPEPLRGLPVILVARGCLAPYFLSWWQRTGQPLFVLDFSRWRSFAHGAGPEWIGEAPPPGEVILFDRNTTTGQTLRLLKHWLLAQGYRPVVVGHLDLALGQLGLHFVDWIWDDSQTFDRLGVHTPSTPQVRLCPKASWTQPVGGAYTFCLVGEGSFPELAGRVQMQYPAVSLSTPPLLAEGSLCLKAPSWKEAMLLGYLNVRPLVLLSADSSLPADYHPLEADLAVLESFLPAAHAPMGAT